MRHAIRLLRKSPGFTTTAVLTLALGIGANTALFSLVNAMLLRELPFEHASRLVWIWATRTDRDRAFYSLPDFVEVRKSVTTIEDMSAYANWGANLSGFGEPERFTGARIMPNAFDLMGVTVLHGRAIEPADGTPSSEHVVMLSFGLWQRRFGGDASILGQKLILNGDSYRVIGILPTAFVMPATEAELYIPLVIETDPWRSDRATNFLRAFALLKPGSTPRQAASELAGITHRLREMYPETNGKHTDPRVRLFQDEVVGGYRTALWTLLGAVGLVLLIACSNLANLLLARASARSREVAIRSALGATRFDLIRQLLTESLLLAGLGGALGILLARGGLRLLLSLSPADLPRTSEVALDAGVLSFAVGVSVLSGILFGLAPALHATRLEIGTELKTRSRPMGASSAPRSIFVMAEVALSIVLLIGAGLFLKTFLRMQAVSPGFPADHLLLMRLSLPKDNYATAASMRKFYDNLKQHVAVLPGVQSVALASVLPLSAMNVRSEFYISGRTPASPVDVPAAQNRWISPGYFRSMGIPIMEGREFSEHDTETSAGVAVVDQTLVKKYWPNRSPLGQHFQLQGRDFEVVGVAGNVKHDTLGEDPSPTLYAPFSQVVTAGFPFLANSFSFVVRTASDPLALTTTVRRKLRAVDANVPASSVKTMDQFLSAAIGPRRFNLQLMLVFAASALLLAAMGLYGVVSYAVVLRTSEIGVRMALGADRANILKLVVGQALRLVLAGLAVGLIASIALARIARSLLFETSAADPATFASVAILFVIVGIAAAVLPARRAMRVDPLIALRTD